jgi:hypothetical protein
LPPLPCSTRITIRWLSLSAIFKRTTSDTRSPAALDLVSAVRLLRLGIASRKRTTSSALSTTGSLLARRVLESLPGVWSGTQLTAFVPFLSSL